MKEDKYEEMARRFFAAHRDLICFTSHMGAESVSVALLAELLLDTMIAGKVEALTDEMNRTKQCPPAAEPGGG